MATIAAIITCFILLGLAIFQLSLIFGAPIGRFAWGGQHTVLPMKLRISSATSIVIYALFAVMILNSAGILHLFDNDTVGNIAIWVLFVYFTLGVFLNAISRSKPERNLMTPIAAALAVLVLCVAIG
jgi:hypothetical protein